MLQSLLIGFFMGTYQGFIEFKKRRGGDSNPRYSDEHTGFRNQLDKPLRHLSIYLSRNHFGRHTLRNRSVKHNPIFFVLGRKSFL